MNDTFYNTYPMTGVIKSATDDGKHYDIHLEDGVCFGLAKKHLSRGKIVPQSGDTITLHTYGGSSIRGVDLNGKKLYYLTVEQLEADRKKWLAKRQKEKEASFKKNVKRLDKAYNKLPEAFQKRLDRFRAKDPNFRVDAEAYEMFCCEQAVLIANACKTPEKVKEFHALQEWSDKEKMVPGLLDGSVNTYQGAVKLAYWFLTDPTKI